MPWFYGFRQRPSAPGDTPGKWSVSKPFDTRADAKAALAADRPARAWDAQHTSPFEAPDRTTAEGLCD